jgi:predicted amidohydrolase
MHVFNRNGEVVAIQDKHNFYPKERPWFKQGKRIEIFEVEGVKIGLVRGNDILHPEYVNDLKGAELIFLSTIAVDDIMLDAVKVVAVENQCYVLISSYIGGYAGFDFVGNAAIIAPHLMGKSGLRAELLKHTIEEGLIEENLDINYIRDLQQKK